MRIFFTSLSILICVPLVVASQTATEILGGVITSYSITSDSVELNTSNQLLIRRAENYYDNSSESSYGYGYQAFHLEFMSTKKIRVRKGIGPRKQGFAIELYDEIGELLANIDLSDIDVAYVENLPKRSIYTYSINLEKVPIVLFDHAVRINLIRNHIKRYW